LIRKNINILGPWFDVDKWSAVKAVDSVYGDHACLFVNIENTYRGNCLFNIEPDIPLDFDAVVFQICVSCKEQ